MKRLIVISLLATIIPQYAVSQDDMYFVPSKNDVANHTHIEDIPSETYSSGCTRSVDEYNRWSSNIQKTDSLGNDVIDFDGITGAYPDSTGDYTCTREMNRFDNYEWTDPYWAGYYAGRSTSWIWDNPWYYGSSYFNNSWLWYYDPWYYSWYPHHNHWPTVSYRPYRGITGTSNHGNVNYGSRGSNRNGFSGYRGNQTVNSQSSGTGNFVRKFNNNSNRTNTNTNTNRNNVNTTNTRSSFNSNSSFGSSRSSGSFGGSRGSGGSSGGTFRGRR